MVDFASVITLALVLMDLVAHYAKIEHVRFIVKMGESAPCQEINANVEMVSMDLGATKGKSLISYRLFLRTILRWSSNSIHCHHISSIYRICKTYVSIMKPHRQLYKRVVNVEYNTVCGRENQPCKKFRPEHRTFIKIVQRPTFVCKSDLLGKKP